MDLQRSMDITAKFIGKDDSLGYKKDKKYKLNITHYPDKHITIRRYDDGLGVCEYTSVLTFLDNWDNIKSSWQK